MNKTLFDRLIQQFLPEMGDLTLAQDGLDAWSPPRRATGVAFSKDYRVD